MIEKKKHLSKKELMNTLQISTNKCRTTTNRYIKSLEIMCGAFINTIEATRGLERILKILSK